MFGSASLFIATLVTLGAMLLLYGIVSVFGSILQPFGCICGHKATEHLGQNGCNRCLCRSFHQDMGPRDWKD